MREKITQMGIYIILALAIGVIAYTTYLMNSPRKVIDMDITPVKEVYHAGEPLSIEVDYCKYVNIRPTIQWSIQDGSMITFPAFTSQTPEEGCDKVISKTFTIPGYACSGTYTARIVLEYQLNVLRKESFMFESEPFEIIGNCNDQ